MHFYFEIVGGKKREIQSKSVRRLSLRYQWILQIYEILEEEKRKKKISTARTETILKQ